MDETVIIPEDMPQGLFTENLLRNNKKIRNDRALAIVESAEMLFKRTIEDMELELKTLKRDRNAMLDLSPTTADSLVLASEFNAQAFVNKDIEIGIRIHQLEIKLEIARTRFVTLFTSSKIPA